MSKKSTNEPKSDDVEEKTLKRLLSMPPQPKTKKLDDASPPKKRGRPALKKEEGK